MGSWYFTMNIIVSFDGIYSMAVVTRCLLRYRSLDRTSQDDNFKPKF